MENDEAVLSLRISASVVFLIDSLLLVVTASSARVLMSCETRVDEEASVVGAVDVSL